MAPLVELSERVLVATSTMEHTTTTVIVGTGGNCLLVDAGGTADEMAALAGELAERGLRPVAAWSTHGHWRHVLWHSALGQVPRYGTVAAAEWVAAHLDEIRSDAEKADPGYELSLVGELSPIDENELSISWDGPDAMVGPLQTHGAGLGVLLVPELGLLVAGDLCSDVQVPLLDLDAQEPFDDYLETLDLLAGLEDIVHVVPGHGTPCSLEELAARVALDRAYVEDLRAGRVSEDPRLTDAPGWMLEWHEAQARAAVAPPPTEAGTSPAPAEPSVIDVDLPQAVSSQLASLLEALERFNSAVRPFLDGNHLDTEQIAQTLEPVRSFDGFRATEAQLDDWFRHVEAETEPFGSLIALSEEQTGLLQAYVTGLSETFAGALPLPAAAAEGEPELQEDQPAPGPV